MTEMLYEVKDVITSRFTGIVIALAVIMATTIAVTTVFVAEFGNEKFSTLFAITATLYCSYKLLQLTDLTNLSKQMH